jgi:DNA-binding PadR family transcriptional regulator
LAGSEKPGSRPEKRVYSVTEKGLKEFQVKLNGLLDFEYRPSFPSDGVFYFAEYLENEKVSEHLRGYIETLNHTIAGIQRHKSEVLKMVPEDMQVIAKIVFSHHELHYQAELNWASEAWNNLKKERKEQ